jgi:hypothetical protein
MRLEMITALRCPLAAEIFFAHAAAIDCTAAMYIVEILDEVRWCG